MAWTVAHQAPLIHGIFQVRILEWVTICFSRGSSWPRSRTGVFCIAGGFFTNWAVIHKLGETGQNQDIPPMEKEKGRHIFKLSFGSGYFSVGCSGGWNDVFVLLGRRPCCCGPCRWSWLPPSSQRVRDTPTVSCFWRPEGPLILWFLEPTRHAEPLQNAAQLGILSSNNATVPMWVLCL